MLTVPYIKNGDAYSVPIEILNNDAPLDLSAVEKVEIVISKLRKVHAKLPASVSASLPANQFVSSNANIANRHV